MKVDAIVYKSAMGHTRRYAELLSEIIGRPALTTSEALFKLPKDSKIILMGWIRNRDFMGYNLILRARYNVQAVTVTGAIKTGDRLIESVRKRYHINVEIPMFYLRGGYDKQMIRGADRKLSQVLADELVKRQNKYKKKGIEVPVEEMELLRTLLNGGDYVEKENIKEILSWYDGFNIAKPEVSDKRICHKGAICAKVQR